MTPKEHQEVELLEKMKALHASHRKEDIDRQDEFENRIEDRFNERMDLLKRHHSGNLVVQFFIALLAACVALVAARLIPFWN